MRDLPPWAYALAVRSIRAAVYGPSLWVARRIVMTKAEFDACEVFKRRVRRDPRACFMEGP